MRKRVSRSLCLAFAVPCVALAQQAVPQHVAPQPTAPQATAPQQPAAVQQAAVAPPSDAHPADASHRKRDAHGADRAGVKAMDRLELGTTDITGNRELPKVMYIVPWKRSDLGDLTGKPLDSLIDQTLQPVDRDVFRRENAYYRAVAGSGGETAGAAHDTGRSAG
ncbi:MAG: hypothetical protein ACREUG_08500, partial [Steroidobacteraceae bacterium]